MQETIKIQSKNNPELFLNVTPGHFSSDRFHVNYYIDMTTLKMRHSQAKLIAKEMSKKYINRIQLSGSNWASMLNAMSTSNTTIDTIVCLDGCEAIGAYMADELTAEGVSSAHNRHTSFYVISPEFDSAGQMIVRDNIKPMIQGKNVLILLASAMSGRTIMKSINCITAYGGHVDGVSVIFGNVSEIEGYPVNAVFTHEDLPDFRLSEICSCPACQAKKPLDAIVNSYGYSVL